MIKFNHHISLFLPQIAYSTTRESHKKKKENNILKNNKKITKKGEKNTSNQGELF